MREWLGIVGTLVLVCGLMWLWPNVVHEPLHLLAALSLGNDASIVWDWGFPATPYTVGFGEVGLVGVLWFALLPSLVSVVIVGLLVWVAKGSLVEFGLASYLSFDLLVNVLGWGGERSDFRFVGALGGEWLMWGLAALTVVMWVVVTLVIARRRVVVEYGSSVLLSDNYKKEHH